MGVLMYLLAAQDWVVLGVAEMALTIIPLRLRELRILALEVAVAVLVLERQRVALAALAS